MADDKKGDDKEGWKVEAYRDGARPIVKAIGDTLGAVAEVVLAPIQGLAEAGKARIDRVMARLQPGFEAIPPERRIEPPPLLASQVMLQLAVIGDDEESKLRKFFQNLLLASMDRETAGRVHPAYASMLAQLSQDEAWILESIRADDYAVLDVRLETTNGPRLIGLRTFLGDDLVNSDDRKGASLWNLHRLGILHIELTGTVVSDSPDYNALEKRVRAEFPGAAPITMYGMISVTSFGLGFLDTCVRPRHRS